MKFKISSRIFAVLLSASVIIPAVQTAGFSVMAENNPESYWTVSVDNSTNTLQNFASNAFTNAMETYTGPQLTPLACYGAQVVAGYNYYFICRQEADPTNAPSLKEVVVYCDPNGNSTVSSVEDFDLNDYATDHVYQIPEEPISGNTEVADGLTVCTLPDDAQTIFDRLYANIVGVSNVPIAYLGKQTNDSGTDYAFLCHRSAVVANPDEYIDVTILHEGVDGEASHKSTYSILGSKGSYEINNNDNGKLNYVFEGTSKNDAGYAQGTITLDADESGTYKLYWADDSCALQGYYPIGELNLQSGQSGSVNLGYHTVIPADATKVIATKDSLYTSDAYSVFTIPSDKLLSTRSGNFLYSFSTYSDIHIDKGGVYYCDADKNFTQALKYSNDKGTDYIIVSGDCVTNDSGPDKEWDAYAKLLSKSDYVNPVWESDGNHDLRQGVESGLKSFIKGSGTDGSKSDKSYFAMTEKKSGDLFIFMSLELHKSPNLHDEFSDEQLAWVTDLIRNNYNDRNIFIVQHSPIKGYGAGDRISNPYYAGSLNPEDSSTKAFKALLETYPNVVFLSGHTHEDFVMDYNYSDENGTSANMIHTPSLAGSTMPNSTDDDLDRNNGKGFNSQGYYVAVYENEIVFYGANITDEKIYPKYSYIMEGSRTSMSPVPEIQDSTIPLVGNIVDITQELKKVSSILTDYYAFSSYDSYQALKKLYYQFRFEDTADQGVIDEFENRINALSDYTGEIIYNEILDTYYFVNNKNWDKVYLYAWNDNTNNAEWPGKTIEKVGTNEYNQDIYKVTFDNPGEYKRIIFNGGGSSNQTVDISLERYSKNGFYIDDSINGKYTVKNFNYTGSSVTIPDKMSMLYYVQDEHDWTDTNTTFVYNDDNGIYKLGYDAKSENNISLSLYNKTRNKYICLSSSVSLAYEEGKKFTYQLEQADSRGKSITISGLAKNKHIDIEFDSSTNKVTIIFPGAELENKTTITAESIKLGNNIIVNAVAQGGTGEYSYEIYIKKNTDSDWTNIGSSNSCTYVPKAAGSYVIKTVIKDSSGKSAEKELNLTVMEDLTNKTTVSKTEFNVGESITVKGAATGGSAPYAYEFYYKRSTVSSWTKFGKDGVGTFKPGSAGSFTIKTCVTDCDENTSVKEFTLTAYPAISNTTTVTKENFNVGETITVKGSATGGKAPYTYEFYYKRSTVNNWTRFDKNGVGTFKPGSAGTFTIKTYVKDSTGKASIKEFTLTAAEASALTNNTTVSKINFNVGEAIAVKGAATGGTAPYNYEFYYKRSTVNNWTRFDKNGAGTFKPGSAGTFTIKTYVKDSTGKASVKEFTLTAYEPITNTTTVTKENFNVGETITVKGSATGGMSPYTYEFYYKRSTASNWTRFDKDGVGTFKPGSAGTFTIKTYVKDYTGKASVKEFTLTAK